MSTFEVNFILGIESICISNPIVPVFARLLQRFYSSDPAVSASLGEKPYALPLSYSCTLPAFFAYVAVNVPLLCTPWGRQLYWQVALGGTLVGLIWVKIRS